MWSACYVKVEFGTLSLSHPKDDNSFDIPEIKLLVISRMVCAQIQALETVEGGILHRLFNEECPQVPPLRDASTYNATQHGYRFIRELR